MFFLKICKIFKKNSSMIINLLIVKKGQNLSGGKLLSKKDRITRCRYMLTEKGNCK